MNIFYLDTNPVLAASMLADKHVVKMALESAQILSTVSWNLGGTAPYRATHRKHPCVLWAQKTNPNWTWLVRHGLAICEEYTRRYGKIHASQAVIISLNKDGKRPNEGGFTMPALCMPIQYQGKDPVESYRNYYFAEKRSFSSWKYPASIPDWFLKRKRVLGLQLEEK